VKPHVRRAVAFIAAQLVSGGSPSSVYDHSEGRSYNFSGTATTSSVDVYDYDKGCHVNGSPDSLYHAGDGTHLNLKVEGYNITGYDGATETHFTGTVSGTNVQVYDYETGTAFDYTV